MFLDVPCQENSFYLLSPRQACQKSCDPQRLRGRDDDLGPNIPVALFTGHVQRPRPEYGRGRGDVEHGARVGLALSHLLGDSDGDVFESSQLFIRDIVSN